IPAWLQRCRFGAVFKTELSLFFLVLFLFQKVPVLATRAFSSSARQMKNKVPEAQKLFQADNGLPVHIKGGTTDVLMYRATMTLTIAGNMQTWSEKLLW
ncbi:hypothetical protein L3Q82_018505, partial [Scortum barcoo]